MKKFICFGIVFLIFSCTKMIAQEYKAYEYWKMENDSSFTMLLEKQKGAEPLSKDEQNRLDEIKSKLSIYFDKLSDNEKSIYYKNRAKWASQPASAGKQVVQDEDVFSGERSKYTQYLVSSGLFGFLYGTSAAYILGMDNSGAIALPLLSAGVSTLIPMFSIKDKNVSYNSLALSIHGKTVGGLQGVALGFLITGDNVEDGKLILGIATVSSITLGRVGYVLGRDKPWSQGQVALYSHYGLLMPLEGLALDAAFNISDPRALAATSLVFGAGGYFIADHVARWNDFTRGDVIATKTLSYMNGFLGLAILSDLDSDGELNPATYLIPAAGALGGTIVGHYWLKDARLTNQQGRNTALGSAGGALIGLGLMAIFSPETAAPYYIMGYATGMASYALLVTQYKKSNKLAYIENEKASKWNVSFMPQNLLINRRIAPLVNANPGKRINYLPAFSASLNF